MSLEQKIVPTLREGIDIIKMVLFSELKRIILSSDKDIDDNDANNLTGAAINTLFGVSFEGEAAGDFGRKNPDAVKEAIGRISTDLDHLKIPLTDALRMQFLCDNHEGIDSTSVLTTAEKLNVLILERDMPMPGAFMNMDWMPDDDHHRWAQDIMKLKGINPPLDCSGCHR